MNDPRFDDERPETDLERLLQAAGPRERPSAEVAAAVRAAVADEWRATVSARRARTSRTRWFAAAASVAAAVVAVWLVVPRLTSPVQVAAVQRVEGPAQVRHGDDGEWQALDARGTVLGTDVVRTAAGGRVALRRLDGLEIRIDTGTTVAFRAIDQATLESGRIYVDAGPARDNADGFTVGTPLGNVRHLGTQYSVALLPEALDVAVREGQVAIDGHGDEPVVGHAGERLRLATDGRIARESVPPHDASWRWAESIAPAFEIDGRSLDAFLAWAARETGRQLVYGSPAVARTAEELQLKGSVAGMSPETAVAAVMTTTPSLRHRYSGAQLRIEPAGN
jgi:ferric-dicitrate binding protein FerR (iron transport regulator)